MRPYRRHGKPWHRPALQNLDDYDIIQVYGAESAPRGALLYSRFSREEFGGDSWV